MESQRLGGRCRRGPAQGRWEYWLDGELMLWWSESDRLAFRQEREDGAP